MRHALGVGIIQMWRYMNIWLPQLLQEVVVLSLNPDFILVTPSLGGTLAMHASSLRLGSEGEASLVGRSRFWVTTLLWSCLEELSLCWRILGQVMLG